MVTYKSRPDSEIRRDEEFVERIKKNENYVGAGMKVGVVPSKTESINKRKIVQVSKDSISLLVFHPLGSVRKKWIWKMGKYISRGEAETNEGHLPNVWFCFTVY